MNASKVHWDRLPAGTWERAVARVAQIANSNTVFGGASAMVKVRRAQAMNLPHAGDMAEAVAATYSASTGSPSPEHRAWECGECGSVHLGESAAAECCAECE